MHLYFLKNIFHLIYKFLKKILFISKMSSFTSVILFIINFDFNADII